MALPVEINPLHLQTSGGYTVSKSLRFRSSASSYLNRTFGAPTSATTWTVSFWAKLGSILSSTAPFIGVFNASSNNFQIRYSSGNIEIYAPSTGTTLDLLLTQVFRDPSAWYHFVLTFDTTQATASNRVKFYVNGSQVTAFTTATYPALNATVPWNTNGTVCFIGAQNNPINGYFDGYMAEVNFIDGQALAASSFGAYDTNGVWQPKKYSGTYGTNGFYLTFGNTTSTATLGNDSSGNGNTWTVNNISLTAGSTYDSMTDSPTVSSASVANYAVGNPLNPDGTTWSNGNLAFSVPNTTNNSQATFAVSSGKWYWETIFTVAHELGVQQTGLTARRTNAVTYNKDGTKYVNGTNSAYGATYTNGDVIGTALDMTGGTVTFYKNNASQGSISLSGAGITNATMTISAGGGSTQTGTVNFGQQPFTYTPPTGFNALNTYNLPTPTIANGAQYMAATTYTGTGASGNAVSNATNNTIGTTFQPDFVWIKSRSVAATDHALSNVVAGFTLGLSSNNTAAEFNQSSNFTSVSATGFTVQGTSTSYNQNAAAYVGWQWKANGTGVSNTNGSITSTVSANTMAGFSVVTFNSNATAGATVGHGLGVAPNMIFVKSRSIVGDWGVYHSAVGNTGGLILDTTAATNTTVQFWNNTSPTSSVFSLGNGSTINPTSGTTMVAYCWAAVSGYSAFGSYTGNGSADGTFVYLGFRPRFIMLKRTDTTSNWLIIDSSRGTYNADQNRLFPNSSVAEDTSENYDLLSNGFKPRDAAGLANNGTIIYAAFAENPFNSSRAR